MIVSRVADRVLDALLSEDRVIRLRSDRARKLLGLLYVGSMSVAIAIPILGALVTKALGVAGVGIGGIIAVLVCLPCARFLQTEHARDLACNAYRDMCSPGDLEAGRATVYAVEYGDHLTAVIMYAHDFGVSYDDAKVAVKAMIRDQLAKNDEIESAIMC